MRFAGLRLRLIYFTDYLTYRYSIDKARGYGWYGYCDTVASMRQVFEDYADMKMTPPLPR